MSTFTIYPTKLAFLGVLIERPCAHCDTVDLHFDGLCNSGPCAVCGIGKHSNGWQTHPVDVHGEWRSELPMHDFTPGIYFPADFEGPVPAAFEAILGVVREIGMPGHYLSDLFRDYQQLVREAPRQFIWAVRSTGTDIILPHADIMREPRLDANERFFTWDETYLPGLGLNEVSKEDARALLEQWHAAELRARQEAPCHGPTWHDDSCAHQAPRGWDVVTA